MAYKFDLGFAEYLFGCGLAHILWPEEYFEYIAQAEDWEGHY